MPGRARQIEVANRLEELSIAMKELAIQLRDDTEDQPYAAVYWLRREISREVAKLGEGVPNTRKIMAKYEQPYG